MEILKGMVKDPGYPDCECTYLKTDDGKLYYYIKDGELPNKNIMVSNILKEAIGHAPYTSVGLINQKGEILIPFENKNITKTKDDLLIVEKNIATTQSVLDALKNKSDPFSANKLVEDATSIKNQLKTVMGYSGELVFDNQFSEAALYNFDGLNVGGGYYSFIGKDDMGNYYLTSNVLNSQIVKYDPIVMAEQLKQNKNDVSTNTDNQSANIENAITNTDNKDANMVSINEKKDDVNTPIVPFNQSLDKISNNENNLDSNNSNALNVSIPNVDIPIEKQIIEENNRTLNENSIENNNMQTENVDDNLNKEVVKLNIGEDNSNTEENNNSDNTEETEEQEDNSNTEENNNSDNTEETEEQEDNSNKEKVSVDESNQESENLDDYDITNPVILSATNTIRKLLDENRKQRQTLDKLEDELENTKSSNEILKTDNNSKEKEIISIRKSLTNFRSQNSNLTRENNKLKTNYLRQKDIIENLKIQNTALKEQVAGISALGSAVEEANTIITPDENTDSNPSFDPSLNYLDDFEDENVKVA